MNEQKALATRNENRLATLENAIGMWADSRTDSTSKRRADLVRDSKNALLSNGVNERTQQSKPLGFFRYYDIEPDAVTPLHVKEWQTYLEGQGLSMSSVYARVSALSSFYDWLMSQDVFKAHIRHNPVESARPKAPKAYQSEGTQSLSDADVRALLETVKKRANSGDLAAKRDYALLLLFFFTGKRRNEIIALRWKDVRLNGVVTIHTKDKGGKYGAQEVGSPDAKAALLDYLTTSGRLDAMQPDSPLWIRHDRSVKGEQPLTSHGFVKAFKTYALEAGIGDVHLHQTRHTFGRWVSEDSGSLTDVQTALGHENLATTREYVKRVAVKRDRWSEGIARRLGKKGE